MNRSSYDTQSLAKRCERQRLRASNAALLVEYGRTALPGLAALLVVLVVLEVFRLPQVGLLIAVCCWLLIAMVVTWRGRRRWQIATWKVAAYVDKMSGARGVVMRACETGVDDTPLPAAAFDVAFPTRLTARHALPWLLLAAAYGLGFAIDLPDARGRGRHAVSPMAVERAREILENVPRDRPEARAFIETAEETLAELERKTEGLDREDFEALERIREGAERESRRALEQLQQQGAVLEQLQSALKNLDQREGLARRRGEAASEQLRRARQLMREGGIDNQHLEKLIERAQAAAKKGKGQKGKGKGKSNNGGEGSSSFGDAATKGLRDQIGEMQRINEEALRRAQAAAGKPGKGGVSRGPGIAPLDFSHRTRVQSGTRYDDQTFSSNPSDRTVLLNAGLTRRADRAHDDGHGRSGRTFQKGTTSRYWQKRIKPHHRAVLDAYFSNEVTP